MKTRRIWIVTFILLLLALIAGPAIYRRQQRLYLLPAECVAANRQKNWQRLERLASEWTALQSSPGAAYWLGIALKEQHQFQSAFQAFERVPIDGPRGLDSAVERMEIQFHVFQQPLIAIELADQLLRYDSKLASPRRHLIYFHAMMLHRPQLIEQVRLAIADHVDLPEHYVYLMTMEDLGFRDADQIAKKWSDATPQSSALKHVHLARQIRAARAAVLTSPTAEAIERYAALQSEIVPQLNAFTDEPIALDTLFLLAMDDGNAEEAGRLLTHVSDAEANDPCVWRYRGWYAMRTGDLQQAEESYRQALELFPLGWQTRHEYSSVLRLRGRGTEAAEIQSVAAQGSALINEIRRLPHTQNVSFEQLKRVANYAISCHAPEYANGILRQERKISP